MSQTQKIIYKQCSDDSYTAFTLWTSEFFLDDPENKDSVSTRNFKQLKQLWCSVIWKVLQVFYNMQGVI